MIHAFRLLARLKFLRGTAWDPFGRTAERKTERKLIDDYLAMIEQQIAGLKAGQIPLWHDWRVCRDDPRLRPHQGSEHRQSDSREFVLKRSSRTAASRAAAE